MTAEDRAQRLLDAHVAHVVETLTGKSFGEWLAGTVAASLADCRRLKLQDAVPPARVRSLIAERAPMLETRDGLREMLQAVARALVESEVHEQVSLGELLDDAVFAAGRDKAIAMHELRESAVRSLLESRAYRDFVADLLYHGIRGWATNNPLTQSVPGAKRAFSIGRSVLSRARPGIEDSLDKTLHDYIDKSVEATSEIGANYLLGVSDAELARGADAVWARLRELTVAEVLGAIDGDDAADWAGIAHDGIRHLRGTDWLVDLLCAGVDAFYEHYGKQNLEELLLDFGVDEALLSAEIARFADPVIRLLKRKKLLEPAIRRQLAPFYESEAARAILAD
jgi:hypothetical protein